MRLMRYFQGKSSLARYNTLSVFFYNVLEIMSTDPNDLSILQLEGHDGPILLT